MSEFDSPSQFDPERVRPPTESGIARVHPGVQPTPTETPRSRSPTDAAATPATIIPIVIGLALAAAAVLVAVHGVRITGASAAQSGASPGPGSTFRVVQASQPAPLGHLHHYGERRSRPRQHQRRQPLHGAAGGQATGMVLTPSGVVLTNNHVIQGATSIAATDIGNGKTYSATVVGYDRSGDVAVIQLHGASGLRTVPLGDSSTVSVSNRVLALGNAGGGGGTPRVAQGLVTALKRTITASDIGGGNAERAERPDRDQRGGAARGLRRAAGQRRRTGGRHGRRGLRREHLLHGSTRDVQGFAIPIDSALAIARQIEAGTSSATVHVGPTGFLGVAVVPSSPLAGGSGIARVADSGCARRRCAPGVSGRTGSA